MMGPTRKPESILRIAIAMCATACFTVSCSGRNTTPSPAASPSPSTPAAPAAHSTPGNISSQPVELTDAERILLSDVRDRDKQLNEPAMYRLLIKLGEEMKKPSAKEFDNLPWPGYQQLLEHPAIYRAQAVKVTLYPIKVKKVTGVYSMYFPRSKSYWELHCFNAACDSPPNEPLIVLCPFDPTEILGKPGKEDKYSYPPGKKIELAGVFYKVHSAQTTRSETTTLPEFCNYPVFIAWSMREPQVDASSFDIKKMMIFLIVAALAAVFFILRRHIKRLRGLDKQNHQDETRTYKPLRDEAQPKKDDQPRHDPAEAQVDDELKKAVQEYQKEHPNDKPADN